MRNLYNTRYFVTDLDREAFYAMIEEASESKNVFVIYAGEENFCAFKNGARFISIANARRENMLHRSIEKTCFLSFDIKNDGEVTYSFRKLFE